MSEPDHWMTELETRADGRLKQQSIANALLYLRNHEEIRQLLVFEGRHLTVAGCRPHPTSAKPILDLMHDDGFRCPIGVLMEALKIVGAEGK